MTERLNGWTAEYDVRNGRWLAAKPVRAKAGEFMPAARVRLIRDLGLSATATVAMAERKIARLIEEGKLR